MRVLYEILYKSFNTFFQVVKQNSLNVKEKKLSKVAFSHVGCEKNLVDTEPVSYTHLTLPTSPHV